MAATDSVIDINSIDFFFLVKLITHGAAAVVFFAVFIKAELIGFLV